MGPTSSTTEALQDTIRALEQRIQALESNYHRLKLTKADLLRIQPNDIVVMRTPRPLATSEQNQIKTAWGQLMQRHRMTNELLLICGEPVEIGVVNGAIG